MARKSESGKVFQFVSFIAFVLVMGVIIYKVSTSKFDDRSRASALRNDTSIFADVAKNSYAFGAIERIYRLGITSGCSQNPIKFCPDNGVTRGEAAVLIVRALFGATTPAEPEAEPVFSDIPESHPFRGYIEKMYRENLTSGCSQDPLMFCPDKPLSRREMAAFVTRSLHGAAYVPAAPSGTVFRDVPKHVQFSAHIEALYRDGLASTVWATGSRDTNLPGCVGPALSFCPYAPMTRADMAVILERMIDRPPVFTDVPTNHWAFSSIQRIARENITSGCSQSPKKFCPDAPITRGEAVVLMMRGKHGSSYAPPASPEGPIFTDVPVSHPFYGFIQQFARDGMTSGCSQSPKKFCPDAPLTRGEAAVFMLRVQYGSGYQPPPATGGVFADTPATAMFAGYIEQFYREGMTVGCSATPLRYCGANPSTRAEFAIFLDRLFDLD